MTESIRTHVAVEERVLKLENYIKNLKAGGTGAWGGGNGSGRTLIYNHTLAADGQFDTGDIDQSYWRLEIEMIARSNYVPGDYPEDSIGYFFGGDLNHVNYWGSYNLGFGGADPYQWPVYIAPNAAPANAWSVVKASISAYAESGKWKTVQGTSISPRASGDYHDSKFAIVWKNTGAITSIATVALPTWISGASALSSLKAGSRLRIWGWKD